MEHNLKKVLRTCKILATLIILLGITHDIATFTPLIAGGLASVAPDTLKAMTFMSLMCGTSLIVSGAILIQLMSKLDRTITVIPAIISLSIFLLIFGILAVIYMPTNPFAWAIGIICILSFITNIIICKRA